MCRGKKVRALRLLAQDDSDAQLVLRDRQRFRAVFLRGPDCLFFQPTDKRGRLKLLRALLHGVGQRGPPALAAVAGLHKDIHVREGVVQLARRDAQALATDGGMPAPAGPISTQKMI